MTDERSEEQAISGTLTLSVGGKPVDLPVLTIEQSEAWKRRTAAIVSLIEVPEQAADGATLLGNMFVAGDAAMLESIRAYDVESRLGDDVQKRMTQRELAAAIKAMVDAEFPFDPDIGRSVVEAFGLQTRMVRLGLAAATSVPVSSTNGHSPSGDSIPELSVVGSPRSSSSSSGATAKGARRAR